MIKQVSLFIMLLCNLPVALAGGVYINRQKLTDLEIQSLEQQYEEIPADRPVVMNN